MTSDSANSVLDAVRRALGRDKALARAPVPPTIAEPITRLVHADFGLPELFAKRAADNAVEVQSVYVDDLQPQLIEFLHAAGCRRIAMPMSPFLEQLGLLPALQATGFDARSWDQLTLDGIFDFDAGLTDVHCAVAETGSVAVRATPAHGRALSLVAPIHIAIVQPKDFVGDLVDVFEKLSREPVPSNLTFITGPSKTADIEMNVVTGVHGPTRVKVFVLQ